MMYVNKLEWNPLYINVFPPRKEWLKIIFIAKDECKRASTHGGCPAVTSIGIHSLLQSLQMVCRVFRLLGSKLRNMSSPLKMFSCLLYIHLKIVKKIPP
jgi:hypothetical protein